MRRTAMIAAAIVVLLVAGCLGWVLTAGSVPTMYALTASRCDVLGPAEAGAELEIRFRHSVQQTMVTEYLAVNPRADGFVLTGTKYRSYGVGLPFLPEEGTFTRDGDDFVLTGMHRELPSLRVGVGVGTQLTLTTAQGSLELFRIYPAGTAVRIGIAPYGKVRAAMWRPELLAE